MNYIIREATFDDLADVATIHVKSWQQAYKGHLPQEYLDGLDVAERLMMWRKIFNPVKINLFVAVSSDKIVGFISFGQGREDAWQKDGEIYAVYMLQEAWGKGIGYALFKKAAQRLFSEGQSSAHLWVLEGNVTALRSYKKWGGQVNNQLRKNIDIGGKPMQEIGVHFNLR